MPRTYIQVAKMVNVANVSAPMTTTSIRVETKLLDEAKKVLGARSGTQAVRIALHETVALHRFRQLMKKNAGKLRFAACDE
jgi:hypothetical protein